MKKVISVLLATTLALPLAAQAQDRRMQPQQEASPFNGAHVTVEIGRNDTRARQPGASTSIDGARKAGLGKIRGAIGYDAALGTGLLIGAEAGVGTGGSAFNQASTAGGKYRFNPGFSYDLTARAGVMPVTNLLIYGRGGYRWLRHKEEISGQTVGNRIIKGTDGGWTYGGGVELAVNRSFSVRGEYTRTNFDKNLHQNRLSIGGSLRF